MQKSLFIQTDENVAKYQPLADRLRPRNFDEMVGQKELINPESSFRILIEKDKVPNCIFWGPPGTGKTTLAEVIALTTKADFVRLSAVTAGVQDIRKIVSVAKEKMILGKRTILFIDEIHRFNKSQQDALLPHIEKGVLICIGATTENPSFEVNQALLSRVRVFVLHSLSESDLRKLLQFALMDKERGLGNENLFIEDYVLTTIAQQANGDARSALNILEMCANAMLGKKDKKITYNVLKIVLQRTQMIYDKNSEEHYNIISALHKSMRGSDSNAALYWLARMLEAGEDPMYVARRIVRFASEDIGLADPQALLLSVATMQAVNFLGYPECTVHLAQAVVYCSRAPKSNVIYTAYESAARDAKKTSYLGVPLHLRNAPTKLMKDLGYGENYKYNPNFKEPVEQDYLPKELKGKSYIE